MDNFKKKIQKKHNKFSNNNLNLKKFHKMIRKRKKEKVFHFKNRLINQKKINNFDKNDKNYYIYIYIILLYKLNFY